MSALLDITIIVIVGLTIFFAVKNGFVKTVLSGASFLIALVIALIFVSSLKNAFLETEMAGNVKNSVNNYIADIISGEADEYDPAELKTDDGFVDKFSSMLTIFGIDKNELELKWDEWKGENTDKLRNELVEYISKPVINSLVTFIAFIVLFIGSIIVLKIITYILDRVLTLPVLKQANKLLGLVLGIVLAVVRVFLFCALIKLLLPYTESLNINLLKSLNPNNTFLYKWFADNNLFAFFFK